MRNSFKFGLVTIVATFFCVATYAQREIEEKAKWSLKDRMFYGGGMNIGGGSSTFQIGLNPLVGYMITPKISAGVDVSWQHVSFLKVSLSTNQYGGAIFGRYNVISTFFTYAEYGFINAPVSLQGEVRIIIPRLSVGVGYAYPLGRRGAINAMVLYNLLSKESGLTSSPWRLRVFFTY